MGKNKYLISGEPNFIEKCGFNKNKLNDIINGIHKIMVDNNFPLPYIIDFISYDIDKHFIIHFKSANWDCSGQSENHEYIKEKKEAIKKLIYSL